MSFRKFTLLAFASAGVFVAAACASTNGEAIPPETLDATPLDAGTHPNQGGDDASDDTNAPTDGSKPKDSSSDAVTDAPADTSAPSPDLVRINELYIAGISGMGDKDEYVELYGPPGTPLSDLKLRLLDETGAVTGDIDVLETAGDVIPANGFWVVGGSLAIANVDRVPSLAVWGLNEDLGAVQLVRKSSNTIVDVVGYNSTAAGPAAPAPPSAPLATVEGTVATQPASGTKAFGRKTSGGDTNANATDFCPLASHTPGAVNAACSP